MDYLRRIRYAFVFNRTKRLNKDGTALIQIRATQNGKPPRYFSTGIYLEPEHWDQRRNCIRHDYKAELIYTRRINEQIEKMKAYELEMIARHGSFSVDRLHEYEKEKPKVLDSDFLAFCQREIEAHTMTAISKKAYQQTINKLKCFRKEVYFDELRYTFIVDFDRYLHRLNLHQNTIKKHHSRLHSFILEAIRKDLFKVDDNPYKKFQIRGIEPDRVFLTDSELARIEQLTFAGDMKHLERIRDMFLAQSWTGLRYSDISKIKAVDFSESSKGLVLNLKAQKTGKFLPLPLYLLFKQEGTISKPEQLFRRYLETAAAEAGRPLFGSMALAYYNRCLKVIARQANIRKKLTSHVARRGFGTSMATRVQMPVLQKLLQHQDLSMTKIYVQLSNELIESELEKVKW